MTRLAFLGTPDAAVPTLEALNREHEVAVVVTQPDRPRGRSKTAMPPPVKQFAVDANLPVAQPDSHTELREALTSAGPVDLAVVVAYGRILRADALAIPHQGMLNVHFSLLPRWRGAAPVNRALIAGDPMTGVTIIKIDEGLDTGPVLNAQAVDILPDENAGELTARLAQLGASLLSRSIAPYLSGDLVPHSQSDEGVTYARKLEPKDRPIDANMGAGAAYRLVRGLAPSPTATLLINGEMHKILTVERSDSDVRPGRWECRDGHIEVGLVDGSLRVLRLQPSGKNPMSGSDWLRGRSVESGIVG